MQPPSKKEIKREIDKIKKLYDCYSYVYANADDELTRRKITELFQTHIQSKIDAIHQSVIIPLHEKRRLIEELQKKLSHDKENKDKKS